MEKPDLGRLLADCRAGDAAAMNTLLEELQRPVYFQCRKLLGNEQDALDAAQEILILVLRKLDQLREPGALWGWVNRITANCCKNILSRRRTELPFWEDAEGNSLLDEWEDPDVQTMPEAVIDTGETRRMISQLVDALPESQRLCVMLYYYDEMPVKEIAAVLETPENTVKSRLNYARKTIREGVLAYEKQGVRLYGFSPLPFLLYFLRKSAEAEALDPEAARRLTEAVLSAVGAAGAAAGTTAAAAGTTAGAAGATAGAAGTAAGTGVLGGVSVKVVAAVTAGALFLGGGGILAARHFSQPAPAETQAVQTVPPASVPPETAAPAEAAVTVADAVHLVRPAVDALDPGVELPVEQRVILPRLEAAAPSANLEQFNAEILAAYQSPLEKLESGQEGDELYDISYEWSETDGAVGILVHAVAGWQYSESYASVDGYYYDLDGDCALTPEEYVARCGGDWARLREAALALAERDAGYQGSEDVRLGDAVLFDGERFHVEVEGVFAVSGYPWTAFWEVALP